MRQWDACEFAPHLTNDDGMTLSHRLRLLPRGAVCNSISRLSSTAARKMTPPRILHNTNGVRPPEEVPRHHPLAPRHIECWSLWQSDGLSIKQIGERLNMEEETILNHLIVSVKKGCPIDWVDICKEANLTPNVAVMLEEAYFRSRGLQNVTLNRFCPPNSVTYEQCALFGVMKSCGIAYQGILLISSAASVQGVERTNDRVLYPRESIRATKLKHFGRIDLEAGGCDVEKHSLLAVQDQLHSAWRKLSDEGPLTEAVEALDLLVQSGSHVDTSIFYRVLKRCIVEKNLEIGKQVHALAQRCGYNSNTFLANHIIRLYASNGQLDEAMHVFSEVAVPSLHMWASIILAHARHGQAAEAIRLYRQMRQSMMKPDNYIFVAVLRACATLGDLDSGKEVHADCLASAVELNLVTGNCLVDMYAKCGSLEDARRVFDNLQTKDVVTWTAMIAGYVQHEFGQEALSLYANMEQEGVTPANNITFLSLVQACGIVGALQKGKQIHSQILRSGLGADVVLGSCLVDMYANCGSLEDAQRVFHSLPNRDVVTWNALLNGYAQNSDWKRALQSFQEMQQEGIDPDGITFNCLFVACRHEGLVDEGRQLFRMMVDDHNITPDVYHYTSIVDLFGRAGLLDEAERLLQTMPFDDDVVGWTSLLSACKSHGDIERGRRCFNHILERQPENAAAYALLGSVYADYGNWVEVDRLERLRKSIGALKKPARASIEVNSRVQTFSVGEGRADISSKLRSVNLRLSEPGTHLPHTELVLKPISERGKEDALCGHAEKLALAYGLLNTPDGSTLLVTKNLRMCNDCHNGTKILSVLEKREIVVRDANRVHRFVNGSCSCGDRN